MRWCQRFVDHDHIGPISLSTELQRFLCAMHRHRFLKMLSLACGQANALIAGINSVAAASGFAGGVVLSTAAEIVANLGETQHVLTSSTILKKIVYPSPRCFEQSRR